jgi:hypothetical protein
MAFRGTQLEEQGAEEGLASAGRKCVWLAGSRREASRAGGWVFFPGARGAKVEGGGFLRSVVRPLFGGTLNELLESRTLTRRV